MKKAIVKLLMISICLSSSMLTLCKGGSRRDIIEGQATHKQQKADTIKKNIIQSKLSKKSNAKVAVNK